MSCSLVSIELVPMPPPKSERFSFSLRSDVLAASVIFRHTRKRPFSAVRI
jgi:hypothetical protein